MTLITENNDIRKVIFHSIDKLSEIILDKKGKYFL